MTFYRRGLSLALLGAVAALSSWGNRLAERAQPLTSAGDYVPGAPRATRLRAKHVQGTGAATAKRAARRRRNIAKHPRGVR